MCELKSCIVLQKINKTSGSLTEFRNNKHLHVFVLLSSLCKMVAKCMYTTVTYEKGAELFEVRINLLDKHT